MLHAFPIPYPDETFYSLLARRKARFTAGTKQVLLDVLGTKRVNPTINFPAPLAWFQQELNPEHPCTNTEWLIANHTLLPWHAPFLPLDRVEKMKTRMLNGDGKGISAHAGILASRIKLPKFLRYCPECFRDDIKLNRSLYWRRLHQLTGIEVCPEHKTNLENSQVLRASQHLLVVPTMKLAESPARPCDQPIFLQMAYLGQRLLTGNYPSIGPDLQSRYHRLAEKAGFLTFSARIRITELEDLLKSKFPAEYLEQTGCAVNSAHHSISTILRKPRRTQAPIKHLIVLCALGGTLDDLIFPPKEDKNEPILLCPNPVCPKKGEAQMVPNGEVYSQVLRGGIMLWRCPTCDRVYQNRKANRRFIRKATKGNPTILWTRSYGHIWTNKLQTLWNDPTVSTRQMAETLGVTSRTVKQHALDTGLPFPRFTKQRTTKSKTYLRKRKPIKLEALKEQWLAHVAKTPNAGARALQLTSRGLANKIQSRDPQWLRENTPKIERKSSINWAERDARFEQAIKDTAEEMREKRPPVRLSKQALASSIGVLAWVTTSPEYFPKTRATLEAVAENSVQFACRRIAYVAEQFKATGEELKKWKLLAKAGIAEETLKQQQIIEAVQKALSNTEDTSRSLLNH